MRRRSPASELSGLGWECSAPSVRINSPCENRAEDKSDTEATILIPLAAAGALLCHISQPGPLKEGSGGARTQATSPAITRHTSHDSQSPEDKHFAEGGAVRRQTQHGHKGCQGGVSVSGILERTDPDSVSPVTEPNWHLPARRYANLPTHPPIGLRPGDAP